MMTPEHYAQYSPEEWAAYRQGQVDALQAWYTNNTFADAVEAIWDDSCESYCPARLDSDFPRNVVIADVTRAAHIFAFGAIRRAAAVARHHDYEARTIECGSTDFAKRLAAEHFCLGRAVRTAIRAAIGSDKT